MKDVERDVQIGSVYRMYYDLVLFLLRLVDRLCMYWCMPASQVSNWNFNLYVRN